MGGPHAKKRDDIPVITDDASLTAGEGCGSSTHSNSDSQVLRADELNLEQLRTSAEAFMQEVLRAEYLALSGREQPSFTHLLQRYAAVLSDQAVRVVTDAMASSAKPNGNQRLRMLLCWLARTRAIMAMSPASEKRYTWETHAVLSIAPTRQIPYARALVHIADEPSATQRHAIDLARTEMAKGELI